MKSHIFEKLISQKKTQKMCHLFVEKCLVDQNKWNIIKKKLEIVIKGNHIY